MDDYEDLAAMDADLERERLELIWAYHETGSATPNADEQRGRLTRMLVIEAERVALVPELEIARYKARRRHSAGDNP